MSIFHVDGKDFESERLPSWAQKLIARMQNETARLTEALAISQGTIGDSRISVSNGFDREIKVPEGTVTFKMDDDVIRVAIESIGPQLALHVITDRNALQVHPWSTNVVKLTSSRVLV